MELEKLKQILEASLMVANGPLSFERLNALFAEDGERAPSREQLRTALEELENDYHHAGIELVQVGSGYRFQARAEVAEWVNRLWDEKKPRYSRALLETLAIVAYRQPITRGEIENIRGVAVSTNIMRTLLEREWLRVVGHRDVPGKPAVYATTKQFLDYFGLASLAQLPSLADLKDIDDINADLFADGEAAARDEEAAEDAEDAEDAESDPADASDDAEPGGKNSFDGEDAPPSPEPVADGNATVAEGAGVDAAANDTDAGIADADAGSDSDPDDDVAANTA
jgi:segregation and condensation protein B